MEVKQVTKAIDDQIVLQNISFQLKQGEITALIGRNGVGKTTLFSTISGIYTADSGEILINGVNLAVNPALKRQIFFLEDSMNYFNTYNVKAVVKLYKSIYLDFDEESFANLLARFDMNEKTKIISFSKGRKALFFMILAFSLNVKYLLLDEPLEGLDVLIKKELLAFLKEQAREKGTSILIASHRLDELETIADRVLLLKGTGLELDLYLDTLRAETLKIQVAFRTKGVPDFVKKEAQLLSRNGRIYTIFISNEVDAFTARLEEEKPILYEELVMTIEDVFQLYLTEEKIDYLEL
ncbi:ABC transporter ATP-binding protein [Listeria floridensis FSL S10-1187]|uniref:ABC transporter ATP-binding protein n=1 Tax=Listeria floridensis FSL S10-1187 TaxID=1265817 RepID=A0ABN0RC63_9LIST|nr:ABC transporter ATP-binding protein [Listeria floridensis]EUJ26155.1 ABC transporter ATP-binding protein [Listeria floridensis FSL S10-1187]